MSSEITLILILVITVWLVFLTYLSFTNLKRNSTSKKLLSEGNLESILDNLNKELSYTKKNIHNLKTRCDTIENNGSYHIQKIGLLRFNPFKDTGGDQSFILALCDSHQSGILLTGLYSRSGIRWYIKKIKNGKGVDHDLSDEEKKIVKNLENQNNV